MAEIGQTIIEILGILNDFTPLGLAALLAVALIILIRKSGSIEKRVDVMASNHLTHVEASLKEISATLFRLELMMVKNFAYLLSRDLKDGE